MKNSGIIYSSQNKDDIQAADVNSIQTSKLDRSLVTINSENLSNNKQDNSVKAVKDSQNKSFLQKKHLDWLKPGFENSKSKNNDWENDIVLNQFTNDNFLDTQEEVVLPRKNKKKKFKKKLKDKFENINKPDSLSKSNKRELEGSSMFQDFFGGTGEATKGIFGKDVILKFILGVFLGLAFIVIVISSLSF